MCLYSCLLNVGIVYACHTASLDRSTVDSSKKKVSTDTSLTDSKDVEHDGMVRVYEWG